MTTALFLLRKLTATRMVAAADGDRNMCKARANRRRWGGKKTDVADFRASWALWQETAASLGKKEKG